MRRISAPKIIAVSFFKYNAIIGKIFSKITSILMKCMYIHIISIRKYIVLYRRFRCRIIIRLEGYFLRFGSVHCRDFCTARHYGDGRCD